MSSEIYYDRAFIKIGEEQFIPVANHGSSNTFDFDLRGREIPEKHWSVLNYPHWDKFIFTVVELQEVAAAYEEANTSNRGGIRKSRNRAFEEGEFGRWILGGMRSAHTVEEYTSYGNTVIIIEYEGLRWKKSPVATTAQLLERLEELKGKSITVSFYDDRHVTRPPIRSRGKAYDFSNVAEYYVLRTDRGYFVKRSSKRIWFVRCSETSVERARKFKSEKAAQKYIRENGKALARFHVEVERVENMGAKSA